MPWAVALLLVACTRPVATVTRAGPRPARAADTPGEARVPAPAATPEPAATARRKPSPAVAPRGRLSALDVAGFGPAVVWTPPARARPYPLLVAAHGAGDRPEGHCELYGDVVGDDGIVLCPRGRRLDAREPYARAPCYFPDHHYLEAVIDASLAALLAREAGEERGAVRVDPEGAVFAGYSQGATMGALVVAGEPGRFARALLVEGGFGAWNVAIAARYRAGGGRRVALVCGGLGCASSAAESARWLERGGILAQVTHVAGAGHTYGGAIAARLPEIFRWLVADDPRWQRAPTGSPPRRDGAERRE